MKKVLSLFVSFVLLMTSVICVNFSASAQSNISYRLGFNGSLLYGTDDAQPYSVFNANGNVLTVDGKDYYYDANNSYYVAGDGSSIPSWEVSLDYDSVKLGTNTVKVEYNSSYCYVYYNTVSVAQSPKIDTALGQTQVFSLNGGNPAYQLYRFTIPFSATYYCDFTGHRARYDILDASGKTANMNNPYTDPGYSLIGGQTYYACVYSYSHEVVINAVMNLRTTTVSCPHTSTRTVNAYNASCENGGYMGEVYCNYCDKLLYFGDYTNPVGHNFGNNSPVCLVCGAVNPYYVAPVQIPSVKSTSIKKLTKAKKSFKVTWKKVSGVSGYQIQYSTNKKFKSSNKTATVKKGSTTSLTVKKLKSKKTYYVRVRAYKNVNGRKVYSSWSKVKNIKTK